MCVATVDALCCRKKLIAVFVADISLVSCSYVLVVFNLSLPYDMYQKDQFSQLPSLVWLPKIECGQGDTIYSALIMPCLVLLVHYINGVIPSPHPVAILHLRTSVFQLKQWVSVYCVAILTLSTSH